MDRYADYVCIWPYKRKKYKHKLSSNKPVYTQHPTYIVNYIVRIFRNDTHIGVWQKKKTYQRLRILFHVIIISYCPNFIISAKNNDSPTSVTECTAQIMTASKMCLYRVIDFCCLQWKQSDVLSFIICNGTNCFWSGLVQNKTGRGGLERQPACWIWAWFL